MSGSLAEALGGLVGRKSAPGPRCGVALAVEGLKDKDARAALLAAVDNPDVVLSVLAEMLAEREDSPSIPYQTLRRHRRRLVGNGCTCPR